jgi:superfamily II DNA or RNA helicase
LRLVTEATRIQLAHHFDPYLAIHTSRVIPLPHQISAVYGEMLPRQPLRFLLADDPGAGKTIMAGLLIREMAARSDLDRCLIVAPGSLVEQWQDELGNKFGLEFELLTRDMIEGSRSGNVFKEKHRLIARLDVLSRNEDLQQKLLDAEEWDLIIGDEAHRMSATYFGNEAKYTKRYQLGQLLGKVCRHYLLMSATPHNGKEADFQLFMALLDGDRFEGRPREGVHVTDASDMMRRLTKEELLKFDGRPLFPERRAYTVKYDLSPREVLLYDAVTEYVREEMNRVQRFAEEDGRKKNNVGFALQILQRRLASSPAAIYQSLKRRLERLEAQLAEVTLQGRARVLRGDEDGYLPDELDELEEYDQAELDRVEDALASSATSAESAEQLRLEIATLQGLEAQALEVLRSGEDTKWTQLDRILDDELMRDPKGNRRKLIIFTEPKDTLFYLRDKVTNRIGRQDAVEVIHGGVTRDERRKIVERFMTDKELLVLIANDAAGEGVNLQRGHLMVNYDLPWNPNKIEQRFGRIHRIGQTEVCHLWNLVAHETREGEVYARLLDKLEEARKALGGRVYDVLGELFEGVALRDLLVDAIRYGEQDDVKARLFQQVDTAADNARLIELLQKRALTNDSMPAARVQEIRLAMERADAERLQPHHVQSFFLEALKRLGGDVREREPGRWEILHVPTIVRERDRQIGFGAPVQKRYERVCFEGDTVDQQPVATFLYPGHPLMDAVISLVREQYGHLMRQGAVLVDDTDEGTEPRALFLLRHQVEDGRVNPRGEANVISERLQFASVGPDGTIRNAGIAPHLNLRAATAAEIGLCRSDLDADWLRRDLEPTVLAYATAHLARGHLDEVRDRRLPEIDKVQREVESRLKAEIKYWDNRAMELRETERAGGKARQGWQNAQRRADAISDRLQARLAGIERERFISAAAPKVQGGMIVLPVGLLRAREAGTSAAMFSQDAEARRAVELAAMRIVMETERALGNEPRDVSAEKIGYDVCSLDPDTGHLRFIEVKGRVNGADTVMITRQELITSLNKPDQFILALVEVVDGTGQTPRYVRGALDSREPPFGHNAIQFSLRALDARAEPPR